MLSDYLRRAQQCVAGTETGMAVNSSLSAASRCALPKQDVHVCNDGYHCGIRKRAAQT